MVFLSTALLLGRWVVARSRELDLAARVFGDGGDFFAPGRPATAELADLSRELAATGAKPAELTGGVRERRPDGLQLIVCTRPVPIARFGVTAVGRIFQSAVGNYIDAAAYGITWGCAREATLT